jgi:hypothetical protein
MGLARQEECPTLPSERFNDFQPCSQKIHCTAPTCLYKLEKLEIFTELWEETLWKVSMWKIEVLKYNDTENHMET